MKEAFLRKSWREFLPEAFSWIDTVRIQSSTCPAATHHFVPFRKNQEEKTCTLLSNTLPSQKKELLQQTAQRMGWNGNTLADLQLEGTTYTLVPVSSLSACPQPQLLRQLGLDIAAYLQDRNVPIIAIHGAEGTTLGILEGMLQGLFRVSIKEKSNPKIKIQDLYLCETTPCDAEKIRYQRVLAKALYLTRMIQETPPNYMTPERLASIAEDLSKDCGFTCHIRGREEILAMGMEAFHSVGKGSHNEPKLIVIEIPGQDESRTVALVGKGVTFDSGGISLKPGLQMDEMKYDLSGGAAVLGTALLLGQFPPPTRVVCLIGAVENMPGHHATRPGDIVHARNGKSIEILNTDAEGRLVLADLLAYAVDTYQPTFIADIATLTGAVLYALGTMGAALISNSDSHAEWVLRISREEGEPLWQMPLWPEMEKTIQSKVADLKNIASPAVKAGTLVGGSFLREFVKDTPWAHLDIAGVAWNTLATGYPQVGGNGYGVRLLAGLCLRFE